MVGMDAHAHGNIKKLFYVFVLNIFEVLLPNVWFVFSYVLRRCYIIYKCNDLRPPWRERFKISVE